jgi:hypothetical protein
MGNIRRTACRRRLEVLVRRHKKSRAKTRMTALTGVLREAWYRAVTLKITLVIFRTARDAPLEAKKSDPRVLLKFLGVGLRSLAFRAMPFLPFQDLTLKSRITTSSRRRPQRADFIGQVCEMIDGVL